MKDIPTSARIVAMKRKARAHRIRLSILLFILIVSCVYALGYFSSYTRVSIGKIVINGTRIIDAPTVERTVNSELNGKYLYLFSRRSSFLYPKQKIYDKLLLGFPRIEKLSIYRDNLTTLHIDITERSGSYLYCGVSVPAVAIDVGENCYFINSDGYIFDKAPYFSGTIYFKYYLPLSEGVMEPLGSQMLSPDTFHSYARFVDAIEGLGFKPAHLVVDPSGVSELYLDSPGGLTSPKIIFNSSDDFDTAAQNLALSMEKPEFANEVKGKYTTLLYIDLRFKNKVLYKFE